jgi:hypothetical protein
MHGLLNRSASTAQELSQAITSFHNLGVVSMNYIVSAGEPHVQVVKPLDLYPTHIDTK